MTLRQRIRFYQQIAVLLRAGLPVRASVDRLRERMRARELDILAQQLGSGERLGDAFAAAHFLPFESNLVGAGERGGQLETIFGHIAEFWQRELEFRQALLRPLAYPIIVIHLALLLGAVVDGFMYSMPVAVVHLVVRLVIIYVAGIILFLLARFTWSRPEFKGFWLFVPIVGSALRSAFAYRWITALRIEVSAGISFSRSVGDAWRSSGFVNCERLGKEGEEAIRSGAKLSELFASWKQLPRDWGDFIETGEISGNFDEAFKNLEAEAAYNWKIAQERMATWLPKIAYFIALIIAAIPVFHVAKQILVDPITSAMNEIDNTQK